MTSPPAFAHDLEDLDAPAVLAAVVRALGRARVALASSFGVEDMVITDLLARLVERPRVFTLDTGRLHQETYDLMDATRTRYGIEIEVYFPDAPQVETMVRNRGLNLFYDSVQNRRDCCGIRKVEPLRRALATVDGWITGVRRDQVATRATTRKVALDVEHGGVWKVAPLADWTRADVWRYIRENGVPYNALQGQGYASISCAPCTRAIGPGEDERAGRWWWEDSEQKECGIHFDPLSGRMLPDRRADEDTDGTTPARRDVGAAASSL